MTPRENLTPVELLRALAVLCEPPAPEHAHVAAATGLGSPPDGAEFAQTFLFQLYPYASVYLGHEGMLGGDARGRVAGFWRAVGRVPPAEPDHLGALLGLYAGLMEEATLGEAAEAEMARQGAAALLHEHLAPWVFDFLHRVGALGGGFYAGWADLLSRTLMEEVRRMGPQPRLPAHLLAAPELPDPREHGGEPFLGGLLAPVRTGMILTRIDLARLAHDADLGLRVGERRYVLEHLLAQDAATVLRALAGEAEAARARHRDRRSALGVVAGFWEDRADRTAALLRELATEGELILTEHQEATP